jgi:hypothetical protein
MPLQTKRETLPRNLDRLDHAIGRAGARRNRALDSDYGLSVEAVDEQDRVPDQFAESGGWLKHPSSR